MIKIKFFFLLCLLLGGNIFHSQSKLENDSLKEFTYLDLKTKFDYYYYRDKVNECDKIARYFLKKAKGEQNKSQIAEGYMLIQLNSSFPNAIKYIDSVQAISKSLDKKTYPAKIYLMRGNLHFKFDHLKKALDDYILALKYAKESKNERQIAFAEINIAFLKNSIGKHKEAAKIFRYYLSNTNALYDIERHQIQQSLVDAYIEMNKIDSAKILINSGIRNSLKNNDQYNYYKYLSLSGYSSVKLGNYKKAENDLLLCKKYFSKDVTDLNMYYTLFVLGKTYIGLQKVDKAVESFTEIDAMVTKTNNSFPELRDVYTYLIDYYKSKNNKEKQLYYIERFLKVDKKLDEQFKYLSTELPKKYDTPNLLHEKEQIINDLKIRKVILYLSIGFLLIVIVLLSFFYSKSKKTEKKHRKIAQDLITSIEAKNTEVSNLISLQKTDIIKSSIVSELPSNELETDVIIENKDNFIEEVENKSSKTIPEDVVISILKELENFEAKELFLKRGVTLASLAKSIKTNTAYLSEIINTHKGKNFAAYLNDLRIDYAISKLVTDKKFRSYKLYFIAEELGYNNEQAFSLAFKKKTGTTLSIYIKEIEKAHQFSDNL
ncbi:helix-turn-helix domain-containing protein [Chryseobacterium indoltheticum]|uniref:Helix-turn-helix domain-containing protein n=1 Tax=Chryseobacterium indoltheticum TaxID=254 RepID=A0A3G6N4X6_9FLAO|nr:helix-turn-helix domain-containing protein [Chryseobacterium indoltheticum]AZA63030.1 helix-turn-helix domain-containing protein [Chryseobacterium indoltheticum]